MANGNDSGTNLFAIVGAAAIGAAVGAGVALLLAPQSGEETREHLKQMAEKAKEHADELKTKVTEGMDELKKKIDEHLPKKEDTEEAAEEA